MRGREGGGEGERVTEVEEEERGREEEVRGREGGGEGERVTEVGEEERGREEEVRGRGRGGGRQEEIQRWGRWEFS